MSVEIVSLKKLVESFDALSPEKKKEYLKREKLELAKKKKRQKEETKKEIEEEKRKARVKKEYFSLLTQYNEKQRNSELPGERLQIDTMMESFSYAKENQTKLERIIGVDTEEDYDKLLAELKASMEAE